jgi:hypothetical protein
VGGHEGGHEDVVNTNKIKMGGGHQVNRRVYIDCFSIVSSHHSELRNIFLRYSAAACLSAASALGLLIRSYPTPKGASVQFSPARRNEKKQNTHKRLFALIPVTLRLLQLFPRIELLELSRLSSAEVIQLFLCDLRLEVEVVEQTGREVLRERKVQDGGASEVRGEVCRRLLWVLLLLLLRVLLLGLRPETCTGRLLLLLAGGCDARRRRRGWGVVFPEILRVDVHVLLLLLLLLLLAIVCHAVESVHGGWVDAKVRSVHGRGGVVVLRVIAAADAVGGTDDGGASLDGTRGCWVAVPP